MQCPSSKTPLVLGLVLATGLASAQISLGGATTPVGPPAPAPAGELHWGDLDGDGLPDALAVTPTGNQLLHNRGAGLFDDVTATSGLGALPAARWALWGDFDGDGAQDLVAGIAGGVVLLHNDGFGFSIWDSAALTPLTGVTGAHWVDLDHDHVLDLHLATADGELVYRNRGGGAFDAVDLHAEDGGLAGATAGGLGGDDGSTGGFGGRSGGGARQAPGAPGWLPTFGAPTVPSGSLTTAPPGTLGDGTRGTGTGSGHPGSQSTPVLTCANSLKDVAPGGTCLEASSAPMLGKLYPLSQDLYVEAGTGQVCIGTTTPVGPYDLTVDGIAYFDVGKFVGHLGSVAMATPGGEAGLIFKSANDVRWDLYVEDNRMVWGPQVTSHRMYLKEDDGHLGLGPSNPAHDLHIQRLGDAAILLEADTDNNSGGEADNATVYFSQDGGLVQAYVGYQNLGVASENDFRVMTTTSATPLVLGTDNVEHVRITDAGLVSVKQTLEIRGGADIVERFDSSCGELEPGTVVVIDPQVAGALSCSWEAYDTKVAGVVSGAGGVRPGLALGQDGVLDGDTPVAMTGRVYVKCSAENGAITPGDRLTTASLPGHAMKATDSDRADGAVLGKAMSALDEGTGLVLVLVNLQ